MPRAHGVMPKRAPEKASGPRVLPGSVVLFDTLSIVFRSHYALPPMSTSEQEPTGALYGACSLILKVLREHRPSRVAFAVDTPEPTFRHEQYSEYKAQRTYAPTELAHQLRRLPTLLAAFDVPVFRAPGYEADDVLATLATRLEEEGARVLIVSGDRDLLQVVDEKICVWFVGARGKEAQLFDRAAVEGRFGVAPERLPAWSALVGDPSDNIEGISGIGPRTASSLVSKYGSVREILEHLEEISPARVRESLRESAPRVRLNETLTRLRRDVPLEPGPLARELRESSFEKLGQLFEALEFKSLLPRLELVKQKLNV